MDFYYVEILLRLLLACILGGIIGSEREHTNRPAGFRTHILVCVGAALVMVTSEFILDRYSPSVNLDPARLGAQVISGIGFLGAGTIIRDGFNVKGLTTAASLWAVSCVGIAAGIGFYYGAVIATVLIFITLIALKKTENRFLRKNKYVTLLIESDNIHGQVGTVSEAMERNGIEIKRIDFIHNTASQLVIRLVALSQCGLSVKEAVNSLNEIEGIRKVVEE
jgi:putative Mg2+ transporter-C (MgtC) family protein